MRYIKLIPLLLYAVGCGQELTADAARQELQRAFKTPPVMYCQWADAIQKIGPNKGRLLDWRPGGGGEFFKVSPEEKKTCLQSMNRAGVVADVKDTDFTLSQGARFETEGGETSVEFPCAYGKLGDIQGLKTSGNTAKATFNLIKVRDDTKVTKNLSGPNLPCVLLMRSTCSGNASFKREGDGWKLVAISGLGCPSL